MTTRRTFVKTPLALMMITTTSIAARTTNAAPMYGLIGKMSVQSSQRDAVMALLLAGSTDLPGCLSYVVAEDPADPDGIWITEVWDSKRSHDASLSSPQVRDAIAKAKPLITSFSDQHVTTPMGGIGLAAPR